MSDPSDDLLDTLSDDELLEAIADWVVGPEILTCDIPQEAPFLRSAPIHTPLPDDGAAHREAWPSPPNPPEPVDRGALTRE